MRTVTVTGQGEARVAPDCAVVRVSATHSAPGVAETLAGSDSAARSIAATAREHATPARVASTGLSVWPNHTLDGRPDGFRAQHSLTIRCADIEAAGAMLTALAETVGERLGIEGVSLEVIDQSAALRDAREAAYADAVDRATHLADLAGAALGEPQEVVEGGMATGHPIRMARASAPEAVSFEPGETVVGATVTMTFQLR